MKKLAIISLLALAVTLPCVGMFASASNVVPELGANAQRSPADNAVARSIPAQLLTIRCGSRKGDIQFSVKELDQLFNLAEKDPDLAPKVCEVFTKRA